MPHKCVCVCTLFYEFNHVGVFPFVLQFLCVAFLHFLFFFLLVFLVVNLITIHK